MVPKLTSPLVNAIPNASCQADGATGVTTDQRGFPRPDSANPNCDIGAVEVEPLTFIGQLQLLISEVGSFHLPFGAQASLTRRSTRHRPASRLATPTARVEPWAPSSTTSTPRPTSSSHQPKPTSSKQAPPNSAATSAAETPQPDLPARTR
jgi:hypothetical protein